MLASVVLALFYGTLSVLQLGFGLMLLTRDRRDAASWMLGALFVGNGGLAAMQIVIELGNPFSSAAAVNTFWLFDQLTNFLILYLALVFPRKATIVERFPRAVPAAILLAAASFGAIVVFTGVPGWSNSATPKPEIPPWYEVTYFLYLFLITGVVFTVLLLRWSLLLARNPDLATSGPFKLIFAAFGLRAVHLHVQHAFFWNPRNYAIDGIYVGDVIGQVAKLLGRLINEGSTIAAFIILGMAMMRAADNHRNSIRFVMGFMVLGAIEGALLRASFLEFAGIISVAVTFNLLNQMDSMLIRPALVWIAMARHQFMSDRIRGTTMAQAILFVFAWPVFFGGFISALTHSSRSTIIALIIAGICAAGLAAIARRPIDRALRPLEDNSSSQNEQTFIALMHDHYRRGGSKESDATQLEEWMDELGLSDDRAAELAQVVHQAWSYGARATTWEPGEVVMGRYRVENEIGAGGMGITFRARDMLAGEDVVLKLARGAATSGNIRKEARALTQLQHPHIIPILRTEARGNDVALVLPFCKAGSLRNRIDQGTLDDSEVATLSTAGLTALQAVHSRSMVHGDLKPANILYRDYNHPVIADFGVVSDEPDDSLVLQEITRLHASARYLAPERWHGERPTAKSDLYEFGLVLLESCTSFKPVAARTPTKAAIGKAPAVVRPLLEALLQKDPSQRPTSARTARKLMVQSVRKTSRLRPTPMTSPDSIG